MKKLSTLFLVLTGCVFDTEVPLPKYGVYKSYLSITRYFAQGPTTFELVREDTSETSTRNSYSYSQLETLTINGKTCHALVNEIWWDYDYGTTTSMEFIGRRESDECIEFADEKYLNFKIHLSNNSISAKVRYFSIPYDSTKEFGVRGVNYLIVALNEDEPHKEIINKINAALQKKGLYEKYVGLEQNPDFYSDGFRVWRGKLYENITKLKTE